MGPGAAADPGNHRDPEDVGNPGEPGNPGDPGDPEDAGDPGELGNPGDAGDSGDPGGPGDAKDPRAPGGPGQNTVQKTCSKRDRFEGRFGEPYWVPKCSHKGSTQVAQNEAKSKTAPPDSPRFPSIAFLN